MMNYSNQTNISDNCIEGSIELEIFHAQGYFMGEWNLSVKVYERRVLTKSGWGGTKKLVEKYCPEVFVVTYNGVQIEKEDNESLFKELFVDEHKTL